MRVEGMRVEGMRREAGRLAAGLARPEAEKLRDEAPGSSGYAKRMNVGVLTGRGNSCTWRGWRGGWMGRDVGGRGRSGGEAADRGIRAEDSLWVKDREFNSYVIELSKKNKKQRALKGRWKIQQSDRRDDQKLSRLLARDRGGRM